MPQSCILMSDITGSTQLYERQSNAVAHAQIDRVLHRMRAIVEEETGHCVKSQGDDVLSYFSHPEPAFRAAWRMIHEPWPADLSVHVGMSMGEILSHDADIYGGAVNTAARLTSLAKPGELLLEASCYDGLSPDSRAKLLMIGEIALRGKSLPTRVYACSEIKLSEQTVIFAKPKVSSGTGTDTAIFMRANRQWQIGEGESLVVGRSESCDIVLDHAWVSRKHAAITLRNGHLEFADHSSAGSVLVTEGGKQVHVHRRATLLSGEGTIYFGSAAVGDETSALTYKTRAHGPSAQRDRSVAAQGSNLR